MPTQDMPSQDMQTQDKANRASENIKQHFEIVIQSDGVSALDHLFTYLQQSFDEKQFSKQQLKQYGLQGAIWLTGGSAKGFKAKTERLRRLKKPLKTGDKLDFYYNCALLETPPTAPTLIADFTSYSVWSKPRGMLSQGSKWGDHTALYRWVEMNYQPDNQSRQSWIVHRLDRATQGLMLLAHTKKIATKLSQYFEQGGIDKVYQANVWGEFPSATQNQPQTINLEIDGKKAISHVSRLAYYPEQNMSRVAIHIETGRKHQIRYHLSQTGFPIVGDRLYGSEALDLQLLAKRPDLQLTGFKLSFLCPLTQTEQSYELTESQLDLLSFDPSL